MIPIEISRVNQVDAARLDIEMSAMLKEQLVKVFSLMKVNLVLLISLLGPEFSINYLGVHRHLICPFRFLGLARNAISIRT